VSQAAGAPRRPTLRERSRGIPERWTRLRVRTSLLLEPTLPAVPKPPGSERAEPHCVVFSKDRAMQLDACLRSIEQYAPYPREIAVIYTASTPAFEEAYKRIEPSDRVRLVREGDFQSDVLRELATAGEHVVFQTDDDVFFRRPSAAPFVPDGYAAFSLRLGRNTTHAYMADRPQALPSFASAGYALAWDWRRAEYDFAYPLSLNGHVFRTEFIRRLLEGRRFPNPNELEHELNKRRYLAPPGLLCLAESSTVSIPANLVNVGWGVNRVSSDEALSVEALNVRFLAGERIDLERMDFSSVDAAHAELELRFAGPAAAPVDGG
jgi:hypothetical protein